MDLSPERRLSLGDGAPGAGDAAEVAAARDGVLLSPETLEAWVPAARGLIERRLSDLLPCPQGAPQLLGSAVREACLGRGKRVRPTLALLSASHCGGDWRAALDFGCAVEMIHSASLILDDLPCMDNAGLRRGRPTLHRTFGEDVAVLSAVALLNLAYGVVAHDRGLATGVRLSLQQLLGEAVGLGGLTGGQFRDLRDPETSRAEADLASLNHQKTGVLFAAALSGGATLAQACEPERTAMAAFGAKLGLAFQLLDDLQDVTASIQTMGKDAGKDAGRTTFVSLWGVERARSAVETTLNEAIATLGDPHGPLARYALALFRHDDARG